MITLEQPSMAINSADISWSVIRMWETWENVPATTRRRDIIDRVIRAARRAPGHRLKNVVINCHGLPGWVGIGQGFDRSHLPIFRRWRGKVEKIWFVACLVARIPTPAYQQELNTNYPTYHTSDGNMFCYNLAHIANCYVVAPTAEQGNRGGYTIGQVPTFEGTLLSYGPQGGAPWSHDYPPLTPVPGGLAPPSNE